MTYLLMALFSVGAVVLDQWTKALWFWISGPRR